MSLACSRSWAGVCTTMVLPSPKFSVPQSSVQISGRSSFTWTQPFLGTDADRCRGRSPAALAPEPDLDVAAHAGGEVDDDLLVLGADALHHLA